MQKPQGYDETKEASFGGLDNPPAGGTILGIVSAVETKVKNGDKTGEPMLALELDIAEGKYKNFFRDLSEKIGKRMYLRHNRVISQVNYFKGDIKAIEKSNPGFVFNFDEKTLMRKFVGSALREEEYLHANTQEIRKSLKIAYLCSVDDVKKGVPVPEMKRLIPSVNTTQNTRQAGDDDFAPQEALPW